MFSQSISSLAKVSAVLLFISLSVGRCWTADWDQEQQHENNMSFASSSSTSSFALSTGSTGPDKEPTQQHRILAVAPRPMQSNSRIVKNKKSERGLITTRTMSTTTTSRVGPLPKEKLNRYKIEAARQLQASLIRAFQVLCSRSAAGTVPVKMRVLVKRVLVATQAGKYNPAIVHHLHTILLQGSAEQQGKPGNQLQAILSTILPQVPSTEQGSLQGLLGFVSANLSSVNSLLASTLGSVPDLLSGVIKSLTNNLGAVTDTLNGTLASLANLLGGTLG